MIQGLNMLTHIIDLPLSLQPVYFMSFLEDRLNNQVQDTVNWCKQIAQSGNHELVAGAVKEIEKLHKKNIDQLGYTVAILWIADLHWRNAELVEALDYCRQVVAYVPVAPLPVHSLAQAMAHYMSGLSNQMLNCWSSATESYQHALASFQLTQSYWQRVGFQQHVVDCQEIMEWIAHLLKYVYHVRSAAPTFRTFSATLVYPLRSHQPTQRYILTELGLIKPIKDTDAINSTSYLEKYGQIWRWFSGGQVEGYQVAKHLHALIPGKYDTQSFDLHSLNPETRLGTNCLFLTGNLYHSFQVDEPFTLPDKNVQKGDWLLVRTISDPNPELTTVLQYKGDPQISVGTAFECDLRSGKIGLNHVYNQPARFLGEPAPIDFVGDIDFILRKSRLEQ